MLSRSPGLPRQGPTRVEDRSCLPVITASPVQDYSYQWFCWMWGSAHTGLQSSSDKGRAKAPISTPSGRVALSPISKKQKTQQSTWVIHSSENWDCRHANSDNLIPVCCFTLSIMAVICISVICLQPFMLTSFDYIVGLIIFATLTVHMHGWSILAQHNV